MKIIIYVLMLSAVITQTVFVILKALKLISWDWVWVLSPAIASVIIILLVIAFLWFIIPEDSEY